MRGLRGHVDLAERGRVAGWAADLKELDKELDVEIWHGGKRVGSGKADRHRSDLEAAGLGNGHHAFDLDLCAMNWDESRPVSVKVAGTNVQLKHRGKRAFLVEPPPLIGYVAMDIVNNCNLRCPFCVVDYSQVRTTETMREETFLRLLKLLPSVDVAGFWLSCLHEPTLHPRFDALIELIPRELRAKAWFTTNLAKPVSDDTFRIWARSGLDHINVSLDTLNEERFAALRRFGRFKVFKDNLDRMSVHFADVPDAPKLRYITMAFRSNYDEIERIVEHSHQHWLASENEIRYTYNVSHITDAFRSAEYLGKEEWRELSERLARLPYRHVVVDPEDGYEEKLEPSGNYFDLEPRADAGAPLKWKRPIELRARPDGTLMLVGSETRFSVNIHDLEDPVAYFRDAARRAVT